MRCNIELGPWTPWSDCSASCGGGNRERTRTCGDADAVITARDDDDTDNPCKQPLSQSESCNDMLCPRWGEWTPWSDCSTTCGGGSKGRSRLCLDYGTGLLCTGDAEETMDCSVNPCPAWTEWSPWSECSLTCGGGRAGRKRTCALPDGQVVSNEQCQGDHEEEKNCNEEKCPGNFVLHHVVSYADQNSYTYLKSLARGANGAIAASPAEAARGRGLENAVFPPGLEMTTRASSPCSKRRFATLAPVRPSPNGLHGRSAQPRAEEDTDRGTGSASNR